MTNNLSTYFLLSHGSRDPRPKLELQTLAELLSRQIILTKNFTNNYTLKFPIISTGVLELGAKPLHKQIENFWEYTRALHISQMQIIPLFLLPGVHVTEDIPTEIDIFRERVRAIAASEMVSPEKNSNLKLENKLEINVFPYIGSHPEMVNLLATKITSVTADAWILLSHGSRRPSANEVVQKISQSLTKNYQVLVCNAYWSVAPNLESRVEMLMRQGYRKIGVLPYFLFNGGITDAIANTVNQLSQKYPDVKFHLTAPLGATEELAKLVLDLINLL
ncbi:sirohydrochlorin chelatase [Okeania sp.]|uniref:sirohydrochlorin chelatase n=1 Tax=Okeania sp. TaxID=3100323 RepID=UPI002B4ADBCB|nr:sirohydrochlorin chelatase [Okeania sp.]MEB3341502.1 sirohydrochlorin chelatase [Okeania sp.]